MENVIKILSELVSFETYNPPGKDYDKIAYYLRDLFESIGFSVELIEIPEEYLDRNYIYSPRHKGNKRIIVLAKNDEEPLIHFNAHYDVVPAGNGWLTDPYKLKLVGDKAYGRGVSDMKGGIVSMYLALSETKRPVEISLVPDEESGGIGTKYLTEVRKIRAKYVIIGEPSFPDIYIGHLGIIRGVIRVLGKQVHASKAKEGENAFINAAKLALEIQKIYNVKEVSLNLGGYTINSSDNDGVVPGEFAFSFYRSTLPDEKNVEDEIRSIVSKAANNVNVKYEMEIKSYVPGSLTPKDSKLVKVAEECVYRVINVLPEKKIAQIRYDGVFFRPFAEVINIGPGDNAHIPNESVSISNIVKTSRIYGCIISTLFLRD